MVIADNISQLVGKTPLLHAHRFAQVQQIADNVKLLVKLEYFEPSGSVKDRPAREIIQAAREDGSLKPGGTIVEATSGNMGIALASMATALGYRMVVTMPETMSVERRALMKQLGVELVLTDGALGMKGAIQKAEELAQSPNVVAAHQFENAANYRAHYRTTGPELVEATDGRIDVLVAGVGTGGTITGTTQYLKEHIPGVISVAVEPEESAVLSGEDPGKHGIQGIGAGFVPPVYNGDMVDHIVKVSTAQAIEMSKSFAQSEGALVGISSGASLAGVKKIAEQMAQAKQATVENPLVIVAVLPDTAERYLSTPLFA